MSGKHKQGVSVKCKGTGGVLNRILQVALQQGRPEEPGIVMPEMLKNTDSGLKVGKALSWTSSGAGRLTVSH